jgi:hypothetical protein
MQREAKSAPGKGVRMVRRDEFLKLFGEIPQHANDTVAAVRVVRDEDAE